MRRPTLRKALWCVTASAVLVFAALAVTSSPAGAAQAASAAGAASAASSSLRPCNIYAAGGTPCVAAYSAVRALYRTYRGPLCRVARGSDGTAASIGTLKDGYADAAAQDSFCAGTVCTITRIYDQSGHGNDLGVGGQSLQPPERPCRRRVTQRKLTHRPAEARGAGRPSRTHGASQHAADGSDGRPTVRMGGRRFGWKAGPAV